MINESIMKGKWLEFKGELLKAWGELNSDELDKTEGDLASIAGLLQQKYGKKKEEFQMKLKDIADRILAKRDENLENLKNKLKSS
jgi:uncharacterized protein YjbJ (UPF0337 family)